MVWSAITEVDQMTKWLFEPIEEFRADVGFATQFNIHHEGVDYIYLWKILEVVPQSRIVCDWRYEGLPGETTVTWELSEGEESMTLKLTDAGLDSFPDDDQAFTRESTQAGWDYWVRDSMKADRRASEESRPEEPRQVADAKRQTHSPVADSLLFRQGNGVSRTQCARDSRNWIAP